MTLLQSCWSKLHEWLAIFRDRVGTPEELRAHQLIRYKIVREIEAQLRSMEHFLRRILVLAALDLKLEPAKANKAPKCAPKMHNPRPSRISFKLYAPVRAPRPLRAPRPIAAPWRSAAENEVLREAKRKRFAAAAPLAARLEAMLRVVEKPGRYIKRIARRFAQCARRILHAFPHHKDHYAPQVRALTGSILETLEARTLNSS